MDFDKTISNIIGGYELQYGIIYGNENIVFIKCGAGGTISTSRSMSPTMVADYTLQLPDKKLLEKNCVRLQCLQIIKKYTQKILTSSKKHQKFSDTITTRGFV